MKFSVSFIVYVLMLFFLAACSSCNSNNSTLAESGIYYYPEKNVYYDSRQSNYYYSLNGGRSWDSMPVKEPGNDAALGKKIPIQRREGSIWQGNEAHRKEYNGILLNIINDQTILLSRTDSIRKTKAIVAKKNSESVERDEPPQKGLKKFFNKLFGKKKKAAGNKNQ